MVAVFAVSDRKVLDMSEDKEPEPRASYRKKYKAWHLRLRRLIKDKENLIAKWTSDRSILSPEKKYEARLAIVKADRPVRRCRWGEFSIRRIVLRDLPRRIRSYQGMSNRMRNLELDAAASIDMSMQLKAAEESIEELQDENNRLKKSLEAAKAMNRRLRYIRDKRDTFMGSVERAQVWLVYKTLTKTSYKNMRMLNRVLRVITGSGPSLNGASPEVDILRAWRYVCAEVGVYLKKLSSLAPADMEEEWEGYFAELHLIIRHDIQFHVIEMKGTSFDTEHFNDSESVNNIRFRVLLGGDEAPIGDEGWTTFSFALTCYKKPSSHLFNRLLAAIPYSENHKATKALMKHYSEATQVLNAHICKLVRPTDDCRSADVEFTVKVEGTTMLVDWSLAVKLLNCYGAGATVSSIAYRNVRSDTLGILLNRRADDPALEPLDIDLRYILGDQTLSHQKLFMEQARTIGWTEADIEAEIDDEMREYMKKHNNPQKGRPQEIMRGYVPDNTHSGLRVAPAEITRLNKTLMLAYSQAKGNDPRAIQSALLSIRRSAFKRIVKTLRAESKTGNMTGRHCNLYFNKLRRVYKYALRAVSGVEYEISILTQAFVSFMNRDILGFLRSSTSLKASSFDEPMMKGMWAINAIGVIFGFKRIQPYQRVICHDMLKKAKDFVVNTGEKTVAFLCAQAFELMNQFIKTVHGRMCNHLRPNQRLKGEECVKKDNDADEETSETGEEPEAEGNAEQHSEISNDDSDDDDDSYAPKDGDDIGSDESEDEFMNQEDMVHTIFDGDVKELEDLEIPGTLSNPCREWRERSWRPHGIDYIKKILALKLGVIDVDTHLRQESKQDDLNIQLSDNPTVCKMCGGKKKANASCQGAICSHPLWTEIVKSAKDGKRTEGISKALKGAVIDHLYTIPTVDIEREDDRLSKKQSRSRRRQKPACCVRDLGENKSLLGERKTTPAPRPTRRQAAAKRRKTRRGALNLIK